ncbi:MAG: hypothetical protein IT376_21255 [Polyangiaceae bacterium]|nr:hypothetical protein [Polyangiaceae bacterium]
MVRRAARRREQRGAAVFVVVLAVMLLSAVGVFAARSTSIVTAGAGYARQAVQTQYVAELGAVTTMAELGSGAGSAYVEQLGSTTPDDCVATKDQPQIVAGVKPACYKLYKGELDQRVASVGGTLLTDSLSTVAYGDPIDGNFVVELTDPGPADRPVAGTDVGGTGTTFRYLELTLTAMGQVRPNATFGDNSTCTEATTRTVGVQTLRAHVTVGPLPR